MSASTDSVSERVKNARDWASFGLTILTVLIVPLGLLVIRNQRLEMTAEIQRNFVSIETYHAGLAAVSAENASLKAEISVLNAKMDKIQITLIRLTDAVRLKDPP